MKNNKTNGADVRGNHTFTAIILWIFALLLTPMTARSQTTVPVSNQTALENAIRDYGTTTEDMVIAVNTDFFITSSLNILANDNGATLTIRSEGADPVTLTRNVYGSLFVVNSGAKLILENIIVDGNKVAYPDNKATLVKVDDGQFTMKDGAVLKNNGGCGVYITGSGTFTMPGGEITGNNSGHSELGDFWFPESHGGGVYVSSGSFEMTGGKISINTAFGGYGGGVYVETGDFNLGGDAVISGNYAMTGGGVYVDSGRFTMTGGEIIGNAADDGVGGGGVFVSGTFTMTGGKITGNTVNGNSFFYIGGGGVFLSGGTLKLGGTAEIVGNTNSDNAPDNVYLEYNSFITLGLGNDEPVPGKMNVGVQTVTPSGVIVNSGANASHAKYFHADEQSYTVIYENNQLIIRDIPCCVIFTSTFADLQSAISDYETATDDVFINVTEDFDITSGLNIPANDNGATLTIGGANPNITLTRGQFYVGVGAKLILENIIIDGGGVSVDGGDFIMKDGAILTNSVGGVYMTGGTFTMLGGEISHNTASSGGGVYISGGEFIMYGGEISHNTAEWGFGGGVYIDYSIDGFGSGDYISGGTFTMLGGKIINNIAEGGFSGGYGGGVYSSDKFTMLGGEISGNTADFGGGVFVDPPYAEFTLGGSAVISGNTNNNAYLYYSEYDHIPTYIALSTETPPAPGMDIGVNTQNPDGVIVEYGASAADAAYFHSDEPGKTVIYENNQLIIKDMQCCAIFAPTFEALQNAISGYEAATEDIVIAITENFDITAGLWIPSNTEDKTLTIRSADAANPVTLTRGSDNCYDLFYVNDSAKLVLENIIIDGNKDACPDNASSSSSLVYVNFGETAGGEFIMKDGAVLTNNRGSGVYVDWSGRFDMTGGYITGNTGSGMEGSDTFELFGGGVYVNYNGAFNMTGGEISGNTANYGGGVYNNGAFTMTGGKIRENTANYGGGVFIEYYGTFEMTGGYITGNTGSVETLDVGIDSSGGGVYVGWGGSFTMLDGEISSNAADLGGGVYSSGEFTMTDGKISDNIADYGGGVIVYYNGNFAMTGGEISGNNTPYSGGGVYVSGSTFTMTGGDIRENTSEFGGGVFFSSYDFILGGTAIICGNTHDNAYIASGYITISTETPPAYGFNVCVKTEKADGVIVNSGVRPGDDKYFHADEPGKSVIFRADKLVIADAGVRLENVKVITMPKMTAYIVGETLNLSGMEVIAIYSDGIYEFVTGFITSDPKAGAILNTVGQHTITVSYTEGGSTKTDSFLVTVVRPTVTVNDIGELQREIKNYETTTHDVFIEITENFDLTAGLTIPSNTSGKTLTIMSTDESNPVTLSRECSFPDPLITVNSGSKLILKDIVISGNGCIYYTPYLLVNILNGGELIMEDRAVLTNNYGTGVWIGGGALTINGGEISNIYDGGGVIGSGTITMRDGKIRGNSSSSYVSGGRGGGVNFSGTFTMTGGEIRDNYIYGFNDNFPYSYYNGGGVNFGGGTFTVGGTAVISGNTKYDYLYNGASNVYLSNGSYITISEDIPPKDGMNIGVSTETASGVIVESGASVKDATYFHADEPDKGVRYDNGLLRIVTWGVDTIGELRSAISDFSTAIDDMVITVTNDFFIDDGLIIPTNTSSRTLTIRGANPNTTLMRGYTGNLFTVNPGAKLILKNIIINGAKDSYSRYPLIYVNGGELIMEDGAILTNNDADSSGGGTVMTFSDTFTMSGDEISCNTVSNSGGGVFVYSGKFTMSGGGITGNTAYSGGGVYLCSGTFTMTGGVISGNNASRNGGGVDVDSGIFNMTGGKISGNSVSFRNCTIIIGGGSCVDNSGGGVFIDSGMFTIGGTAVISGNDYRSTTSPNRPNNVYLANDSFITLSTSVPPVSGMDVWVSTVRTDGIIVNSGAIRGYEVYFHADESDKTLIFTGNQLGNQLIVVLKGVLNNTEIFRFRNTASHFFLGARGTFKITGDYYEQLLKAAPMGSNGWNDFWDNPFVTYKQRVINEMNRTWDGSCFGMSAVLTLVNAGRLTPWFFDSDWSTLFDISYPYVSETSTNLINYYNLMQYTYITYKEKENYSNSAATNYRQIVNAMYTSKYPVMITFDVYQSPTSKSPVGGHVVVGYSIAETNDEYQISIWDPNGNAYSGIGLPSNVLRIGKNFDWADFSHPPFSSYQSFFMKKALTVEEEKYDFHNIQQELRGGGGGGHRSTSYDTLAFNSVPDQNIAETTLTTNYSNFTIELSTGLSAIIEDRLKINGDLDIENPIILNGIDSELELMFYMPNMPDGATYTVTPNEVLMGYKTEIFYDAPYGGFYTRSVADGIGNFIFSADGSVQAEFDNPANVTLEATINGCSNELYTTTVSGLDTFIRLEPSSCTMIVSSDNDPVNIVLSGDYNSVVFNDIDVTSSVVVEHSDNNEIALFNGIAFLDGGKKEIAKKTIGYSTVFLTFGGTPIEAVINIEHGTVISAPDMPERPGYEFGGWYSDEEYTNAWNFDTPVTSDLTLYAKWNTDTDNGIHIVTFNADNGTPNVSVDVQHGDKVSQPENPTKDGYTFDGWRIGSVTGAHYDFDAPVTENINLYAAWKPNVVILYGDVDGNGNVNPLDLLTLARYTARWPGIVINEMAADVDGNGSVNPLDLLILARHFAGWVGYETLPYVAQPESSQIMPLQASFTPFSFGGQPAVPAINVSSAVGNVGDIVDVAVSLMDNPGIVSMRLNVKYDASVLRLVDVFDDGMLGEAYHSNVYASPYTLFWGNGASPADFTYSGEVATLRFEILSETAGTPVSVSYAGGDGDILNFDLDNVYFEVRNGYVSALPSNEVTLVGALPSASVKKLNGNKNDLTITVTEIYSDGSRNTIRETVSINSNATDSYRVGPYVVYVETKGNDQIRQCYIMN